jgi:hypothetical protein
MRKTKTALTVAIGRTNMITVIGSVMIETPNGHDLAQTMTDREIVIGIVTIHAVAKDDATCARRTWDFGSIARREMGS